MKKSAFSLMEMMIVMLIVAIVAAATAPMITKKVARDVANQDSPWLFTGVGNSIAFPNNDTIIIGDMRESSANDKKPLLYMKNTLNNAGQVTRPYLRLGDMRFFADDSGNISFTSDDTPKWGGTNGGIVIGKSSSTDGGVTFGPNSSSDASSITIGNTAKSYNQGISIGLESNKDLSNGQGQGAVAIGCGTMSYGQDSIAIGHDAHATVQDAVAIGRGASAEYSSAVAIGPGAAATNSNQTVIQQGSNKIIIDNSDITFVTTSSGQIKLSDILQMISNTTGTAASTAYSSATSAVSSSNLSSSANTSATPRATNLSTQQAVSAATPH